MKKRHAILLTHANLRMQLFYFDDVVTQEAEEFVSNLKSPLKHG